MTSLLLVSFILAGIFIPLVLACWYYEYRQLKRDEEKR